MTDFDAALERLREEHESALCFACDRCGKAISHEDEAESEDFCGNCRELAEAAAEEDREAEDAAKEWGRCPECKRQTEMTEHGDMCGRCRKDMWLDRS